MRHEAWRMPGDWRMPNDRPRWWPINEPWPPTDAVWQRRRMRRFMRGIVGMFVMFVLFVGTFVGVVAWSVGQLLTVGSSFLPVPLILFVVFVALVGSVASGRAVRRVAAPLAEVIDATARIAEGDHAVRVQPRGPRSVIRMGEAFNRMAERLEGSERQRRALLADVTHELRTPLTVMQGDLEALLDGVHPRDDERITALLDETKVMSRLVDDLRTLSIADAGALELHREATDVGQLVEDAVASFRSRAAAAQVMLTSDVSGSPPQLEIDPVRIHEVVVNLLDNAIRHTPAGGSVTVEVGRPEGAVAIAVRDTGTGISPEELPRVFERFSKGSASRGSGLGLAIARGLVRAHGGEIEATSEGPGCGTTVRFTLPSA